ncbi:MAG: DUF5606 domain-containing protein [Bacteroidales bacterium]|nr:DUF5606 domain-containing protein [Bacteroidales bacterium]
MFLEGILAISGQPGLYKQVSQSKNSIIVESIETGKRFPTFSAAKISALQDVAIYTSDKEVHLAEVFSNAYNAMEQFPNISPKSADKELYAYFEVILPDYDREKVYLSDIRKVVSWFTLLHKANIITRENLDAYFEEVKNAEAAENEAEPAEE